MDINKSITDNLMEHLSSLGDEEETKQRYPEVYKLLHNTRQYHKLSKTRLASAKLITHDVEEDTPPPEDALMKNEVKYINYSKSTGKVQCSIMSSHKKIRHVIAAIGAIYIDDIKKVPFNYRITDASILKANINTLIEKALNDSKNHNVKCKVNFIWTEEVNNESVAKEECQEYEKEIIGDPEQLIRNVSVTAPTPYQTHGENTIILYHRLAQNITYDYDYEDVVSEENNNVRIHIPFEGEVQLLPNCKILGIDLNKSCMQLIVNNKGIANNKNLILKMEKINKSNNTITWAFEDDWKERISANNFGAYNIVDFHCTLAIQYFDEDLGDRTVELAFDSFAEEDPNNKATQKIHKIQIRWGCFHKDTLVTMSDGTKKLVSQISIGDKIKSKDNLAVAVSNIYTGQEDQLICIETKKGKSIKVTKHHPILTTEGYISAEELHAEMILMTCDGEDEILYLYPEEYGDTVYNFDTDDSNPIIANGIFAGDFQSQTLHASNKENSLEQSQLQKELSEIFDNMHKS